MDHFDAHTVNPNLDSCLLNRQWLILLPVKPCPCWVAPIRLIPGAIPRETLFLGQIRIWISAGKEDIWHWKPIWFFIGKWQGDRPKRSKKVLFHQQTKQTNQGKKCDLLSPQRVINRCKAFGSVILVLSPWLLFKYPISFGRLRSVCWINSHFLDLIPMFVSWILIFVGWTQCYFTVNHGKSQCSFGKSKHPTCVDKVPFFCC